MLAFLILARPAGDSASALMSFTTLDRSRILPFLSMIPGFSLPAELPMILQALEPYRPQLKAVAVESTFNWYWLVDGLQAANYPVRLANPAEMQKYSGLKQTDDETDALWLAEMLRLGILPEGYIYPPAERPVRDMLRRRMLIVRQATQTLLSLQSMVTRHTGQSVSAAKLQHWTWKEVRDTFVDAYSQQTATALLELLGEPAAQAASDAQKIMTLETALAKGSLESVIKATAKDETKAAIFNNAAQVWNHTFFWNCMKPAGGGQPTASAWWANRLASAI